MGTQVSFNNFKAFGPTVQTFSKKPITLIYGPNSVGKSSLLHSQLFLESYKQNKTVDIDKTTFAGDELDFGGFKNIIHKHDLSNKLFYENVYTDKKSISKAFGVLPGNLLNINIDIDTAVRLQFRFIERQMFILDLFENRFLSTDFSLNMIGEKLDENYLESGIKFKYLLQYETLFYMQEMETLAEEFSKFSQPKSSKEVVEDLKERHSIITKQRAQIIKNAQKDYVEDSKLNESNSLSDTDFKEKFMSMIPKMNDTEDDLEKAIIASSHTDASHIFSRLQFFKYIDTIESVKASIELMKNDEGETVVLARIFIDDDELFNFEPVTEKIQINTTHTAIEQFQKIEKKYEPFEKHSSPFDDYSDIHFNFKLMSDIMLKPSRDIQYYGPLRHYPERWEMFSIDEKESKNKEKMEVTSYIIFVSNFMNKVVSIDKKLQKKNNIFIDMFIFVIYAFMFLFMLINYLFSKNFRKLMSPGNTDIEIDNWNAMMPKILHKLRSKKFKSVEIWKILIKSEETRSKINAWLQDSKKMKSHYEVSVVKKPVTYLGIFGRFITKLFKFERKSIFFRQFDDEAGTRKDNQRKKIDSIWNYMEKLIGVRQRFELQLIFKDISKDAEVTPRDMGLGISQALPILISTLSSKNTNIYLEQPELHLHPAVQMELGDEFIRSYHENKNSFMVETHSEHLLLRIMKRMRHTAENKKDRDKSLDLTPDDVCLLYVDEHKGRTFVRELKLDEKGNLLNRWPGGFFDNSYREIFS